MKIPKNSKPKNTVNRVVRFSYTLPVQYAKVNLHDLLAEMSPDRDDLDAQVESMTEKELLAVLQQEADNNMCDSIHQYLIDYEHIMPWDNVDEFEISFNLEEE